jgi:photosystem II stability/assembly factor-like uncharacterized protein
MVVTSQERIMKRYITSSLLVLILLSSFLSMNAQEYTFTHLDGPMGGTVNDFAINSKGYIYAGLWLNWTEFWNNYGLYRSTDDGESWEELDIGVEKAEIISIYIEKNDDIFVGTYGQGLYHSTDDGETWEQVGSDHNFEIVTGITRNANGHLLTSAWSLGRLSISTDNGESWSYGDAIRAADIQLAPDSSLFLCGLYGLYKSNDHGVTWHRNEDIGVSRVNTIYIQNENEYYLPVMYGEADDGIQFSSDGGENWESMNAGNYLYQDVKLNSSGQIIGATYGYGLRISTDRGDSWEFAGNDMNDNMINRMFFDGDTLYMGTEKGGIYRSYDSGISNEQIGVPSGEVLDAVFADSLLFTATWSGVQVYNLNDGTWENTGLEIVYSLDLDENGTMLAGTGDGLYISTGYGREWNLLDFEGNAIINTEIVNDSVFCIYSGNSKYYKISTDYGSTWRDIAMGTYDVSSGIAATNDTTLYLLLGYDEPGNCLVRTTDFGVTLDTIKKFDNNSLLNPSFFHFINDQYFSISSHFGDGDESMLTTDGGETWLEFDEQFYTIYFDTTGFFLAFELESIHYSPDFGVNRFVTREPDQELYRFCRISEHKGQIYAISTYKGLFKLDIITGIDDDNTEEHPVDYHLSQNYPNPFNPATTITFSLPERTDVRLSVFNVLGEEVSQLFNGTMEGGSHEVRFDAADLPSGIYFYQLNAGEFTSTKKMLLLK